ncbi:MAG: acetyl-CoA carboxylase biotin carboxyl carrier protein [Deltaproteobacteria bacterium]|nr:acetyl-CoA carboxylase biotin carboxyl carrier protein [Deltaproteobacteria bacterium]
MQLDMSQLEELFSLMARHGVREVRVQEGEQSLEVRFAGGPEQVVHAQGPAALVQDPPRVEGVEIHSPMVGTFYKAPSPGAPPFVKVGDRVRLGQTLCIVEAMKLLNEIEAEVAGVVVEVLADDGAPVQFGQPLMRILPS